MNKASTSNKKQDMPGRDSGLKCEPYDIRFRISLQKAQVFLVKEFSRRYGKTESEIITYLVELGFIKHGELTENTGHKTQENKGIGHKTVVGRGRPRNEYVRKLKLPSLK